MHLEYKQKFKEDYTGNYLEIMYDEDNFKFVKIYFYSSKYGTIEIINNKKEVHRWETEDEAKSGSYLKRNYPIIGLNGMTNNKQLENKIIEENINYLKEINIKEEEIKIVNKAIQYLNNF